MRLLDQIWQWREPFYVDHPKLGRVKLPGAERLAAPIANADIRYVLGDEVARACASLVYDQPELLVDSIDLIRLPAESMWIEWFDHAIARAGSQTGTTNRRAGFYVQADADGRSGTIRSAWEHAPGCPDRSPAMIEFNLDAPVSARRGDPSAHPVRVGGSDLFAPLRDHMCISIDDEWIDYYRASSSNLCDTLDKVEATVSTDALFLLSFCLLFTMRGDIDFRASDLERLNRARAKRRQPLLLEYREVSARIFGPPAGYGHAGDRHRAASRLHHVRGHFVRRNSSIFWRSPHLRGDARRGVAARKIVKLGLGQAPPNLQL
jgi:hypothetical protein